MDALPPLRHPLEYVRISRGWTYQALVEVLARRVGMSANRQKAWRWEHRGVVPDEETQRALAAELGVPLERLRSAPWPAWLPAGDAAALDGAWTETECVRALARAADGALTDRRGFPTLAPGAAGRFAEHWRGLCDQALRRPGGGSAPAACGTDDTLLRSLEQRLPLLRRLDDEGGGGVRALVDAELRSATALLEQGSYDSRPRRRLLSVAAELGRIAGWAAFDAGYHAAAERYFTAGLRAAHAAGDTLAGANLMKCMTLQLAECDRPREALALASAARESAAAGPPRVRAMLTVRQARAHAVTGDRAGCERLLLEADTVMARAGSEPCPDWAAYFDTAEYSAQVAACYLLLRRHRACDRWLEQALALQPASRPRDATTYLMWRAEAAAGLGEVDRACAHLAQALPAVAASSSARNRARLASVHRSLVVHRGTPAVESLDERVRSLIA